MTFTELIIYWMIIWYLQNSDSFIFVGTFPSIYSSSSTKNPVLVILTCSGQELREMFFLLKKVVFLNKMNESQQCQQRLRASDVYDKEWNKPHRWIITLIKRKHLYIKVKGCFAICHDLAPRNHFNFLRSCLANK